MADRGRSRWIRPLVFNAMKSPRISSTPHRPGTVEVSEVAQHIVRHAVRRISNPVVAAIVEEMQPEIDGLLKRSFRGQEVNITQVHAGLNRAANVVRRVNERLGRRTA
jgi:hypothetical protein